MSDSSSASIAYSDFGREPIGIAQRLGCEYPLVRPSDEIRYLVADLYLNYEDPADYDSAIVAYTPPFSIAWLYGVGEVGSVAPGWSPAPTHDADCIIKDANDRTVFDSTLASVFHTKIWSSRLTIYEWAGDSSVLRIVVHTKWADDGPTAINYLTNIVPTVGTIDARAVDRQPRRLKSITVDAQTLVGRIQLTEGYNCDYDVESLNDGTNFAISNYGQRAGSIISLDFKPGGGIGRYPGCGDMDIVLKRINSVEATEHGDFFLQPQQCYWWEVPSSVVTEIPRVIQFADNTLQLHNNCGPCCECDDFVDLKYVIDSQYALWQADALSLERVRNLYNRMRLRWNDEIACREDDNQRLLVEARCDQYVGIGYAFCPTNRDCAGPLNVTYNVVTNPVGLDVRVATSTVRKTSTINKYMASYALGGASPNWTATWAEVDTQYSARLGFVLRICDGNVGDTVTITTSATFDGNALSSIAETVTIEDDCTDSDPCP